MKIKERDLYKKKLIASVVAVVVIYIIFYFIIKSNIKNLGVNLDNANGKDV